MIGYIPVEFLNLSKAHLIISWKPSVNALSALQHVFIDEIKTQMFLIYFQNALMRGKCRQTGNRTAWITENAAFQYFEKIYTENSVIVDSINDFTEVKKFSERFTTKKISQYILREAKRYFGLIKYVSF